MLVEFLLGFAFAAFVWYAMTRLPTNYPPTPPIRLPILGHVHYLFWIRKTKRSTAFYEMFKRYSKNGVLTVHIGAQRITMIGKVVFEIQEFCVKCSIAGTYPLVKNLFSREETNSRSHPKIIKIAKNARNNMIDNFGVVSSEGKTHQEQRRFMLSTLRDFGFGKSDMEGLINDEVRQFCDAADDVLISAINKKDVSLYQDFKD